MTTPRDHAVSILLVTQDPILLWGFERWAHDSAQCPARSVGHLSAQAAINALHGEHFTLVLIDSHLGKEAMLSVMQAAKKRKLLKVIVLTRTDDVGLYGHALLSGADALLPLCESLNVWGQVINGMNGKKILPDRVAKHSARVTSGKDLLKSLTERERQIVAALIAHRGAPNICIAAALYISPHTLRNHLFSIYSKLGIHTRVELFCYAAELGFELCENKRHEDRPPRMSIDPLSPSDRVIHVDFRSSKSKRGSVWSSEHSR